MQERLAFFSLTNRESQFPTVKRMIPQTWLSVTVSFAPPNL
jgi:hypothetical protein